MQIERWKRARPIHVSSRTKLWKLTRIRLEPRKPNRRRRFEWTKKWSQLDDGWSRDRHKMKESLVEYAIYCRTVRSGIRVKVAVVSRMGRWMTSMGFRVADDSKVTKLRYYSIYREVVKALDAMTDRTCGDVTTAKQPVYCEFDRCNRQSALYVVSKIWPEKLHTNSTVII